MYDKIARFYNRYTADIDYNKLADFAEKCFKKSALFKNNLSAPLVLDAACGTGSLTCILASRGYDMIGLDISGEMLNIARERALRQGFDNILWICQDICKMDLFGSVAAIVCATDSINHITQKQRLKQFFKRAWNFVDDNGLVLFDILTDRFFYDIVNENVFFEDDGERSCLWTSRLDKKSRLCKYEIIFYEKAGSGDLYRRFDETIIEKAWSEDEALSAANEAGFSVLGIYGGMSFKAISDKDLRRFYLLQKHI